MDPTPTSPAPPPPPSSPPPASTPVTPSFSSKAIRTRHFPIIPLIIILILLILGAVAFFVLKSGKNLFNLTSTNITYWGLWEPESVMQPLIDEYQKSHPGVKITYIQQSPKEYRDRLQNSLDQGKGPDIFRLHSSWIPLLKNHLAPIPASVYSSQDFESTFYPVIGSDVRVGNNYSAIPVGFDGLAMYVNDDLLQASGQSVPQNWDDLRLVAQAMTRCDSPDGKCTGASKILVSGASLGTADNVDHWQDVLLVLMLQNNVNLGYPTGKSAQDALNYYTIFVKSDHMWDSTLPSSTFQFAAGKVGIYFAPSWRVFEIQQKNPQLKFSIHPIPQLPIEPSRGEQPITWANYWVEGISKKSPRAAQAWEFLKYLSSPDALQKFYQQAVASGRAFGEPYPRIDMASSIKDAPLVGPYINQASQARSWYLASSTQDSNESLNSKLSKYFADAVNTSLKGIAGESITNTLAQGVNQVLSQYGLATPVAPR